MISYTLPSGPDVVVPDQDAVGLGLTEEADARGEHGGTRRGEVVHPQAHDRSLHEEIVVDVTGPYTCTSSPAGVTNHAACGSSLIIDMPRHISVERAHLGESLGPHTDEGEAENRHVIIFVDRQGSRWARGRSRSVLFLTDCPSLSRSGDGPARERPAVTRSTTT
jgi:hypothetical protein